MPIEQRVIGGPKIGANKIGGGIGAGKQATPEPEPEKAKGGKKKLLIIVGVAVLVLGAAAAYFLGLIPGTTTDGAEAVVEEPAPIPGAVLVIDPVSVNLADGHYLRLGLGLQLIAVEGEAEAPDGSHALDLAIALFSGRTVAEVTDPATRDALKAELLHSLDEAYEGEVMDVYLTNYVTQ